MERVSLIQRELIVRSASGLALGLAILGGIYLGNPYWFALCLLICMASLGEYYRMISQKGHVSRVVGFGAGISSLFAAVYSEDPAVLLPLLAAAPMLVLFVELARKHILGESHGITSSGGTAAGILYIVLPWSFMVVLRDHMWGTYLLVTLFACTWSCDVFSYLVGSRWGETPLCPTVSPKKTVEGFLGGLTGSLLCGGCLAYYWGMAPFSIILIALFCGTFGQVGDLAESLLKREAGIKDTGDLIPGHGGMLDRFDSILVNSVLVFFVFGVLW